MSGRGSVARALTQASGPVWVAAIGKAASAMALGAHDVLGVSIERTLIITKDDHVAPQLLALRNVEIHECAHPVPDQRSLAAGAALLKWVQELPRSVEQLTGLVGRVSLKELVRETTDVIEKLCIEAALELTKNNRASAAEMLGLSRQSLYSKLHRFGLSGPDDEDDE